MKYAVFLLISVLLLSFLFAVFVVVINLKSFYNITNNRIDTNISVGILTGMCCKWQWRTQSVDHYSDVIMGVVASQITSITIVYSTVYSGASQRKHQSSASLAFVRRIHRWPVNSPHKWPVTRKMFPFDDVIMDEYTFRLGWWLLSQFPPLRYFRNFFQHCRNTSQQLNITFMFVRCQRSSAAVTPVKYEKRFKGSNRYLCKIKNKQTEL